MPGSGASNRFVGCAAIGCVWSQVGLGRAGIDLSIAWEGASYKLDPKVSVDVPVVC